MEESIKVSVVVVTYNHAKYISDAINSILSQKTDFRIEIVVADDGSTDDTSAIISRFEQHYPEKIISMKSAQNKGVRENAFKSRFNIRGEYIAILDGDDYWDYELKLQKQVAFLDEHKDYNGVFHDTKIIHVDESEKILFGKKKLYSQNYCFKEIIYPSDLILREIILPSSSAMLRSSVIRDEDFKLIKGNYSFLWKLCCLIIKKSKFYFINEPWSVYRNHDKGISKSNNHEFRLSHIQFYESLLIDEFYKDYKYELYRSIAVEYKLLLDSKCDFSGRNKRKIFRKYFWNEFLKILNYRKQVFAN
ncbi:MAG: hypothetical protein POELPBGB_03282 [Bacteroidia bacterium]|nr:hypothetical protein [Bacteroidia bacterium]